MTVATAPRRRRAASGLLAVGATALYLRTNPFAFLPASLAAFLVFVPLSLGAYAVTGKSWRLCLGTAVASALGMALGQWL
ncbi:hypothetical protein M0R89_19595 (plasmid) [Halorussus limi]|uniref:Uncharacterized protein n=1 Tax=Halorussus limi TaxID=2938695 RepID=A0A8U0I0A7_9EURY|nr:hypothetical protein [Halorussus limi]UPV76366.1 hypothetical protein M0R89_19595 [Halorussus limi]